MSDTEHMSSSPGPASNSSSSSASPGTATSGWRRGPNAAGVPRWRAKLLALLRSGSSLRNARRSARGQPQNASQPETSRHAADALPLLQRSQSAPQNRAGVTTMGRYEVLHVLGQGSFGRVFLAAPRRAVDGRQLALKVLDKTFLARKDQLTHTLTEKQVMRDFGSHPFILGLEDAFQTRDALCLVSEFCPGGDVFYHLELAGRFSETAARFYAAEAAAALAFLHENGVVYRDMKWENTLLDHKGHIRLADFGLARTGVRELDRAMTVCGSAIYMAPEMLMCHPSQHEQRDAPQRRRATPHPGAEPSLRQQRQQQEQEQQRQQQRPQYGFMVDWWTFGAVLFDMLCGQSPFAAEDRAATLARIVGSDPVRFPRDVSLSGAAKDLLRGLLCRNPSRRLGSSSSGGADAIFEHAFFDGIDWDLLNAQRYEPPFSPAREGGDFLRNFDPTFTGRGVLTTLGGQQEQEQQQQQQQRRPRRSASSSSENEAVAEVADDGLNSKQRQALHRICREWDERPRCSSEDRPSCSESPPPPPPKQKENQYRTPAALKVGRLLSARLLKKRVRSIVTGLDI